MKYDNCRSAVLRAKVDMSRIPHLHVDLSSSEYLLHVVLFCSSDRCRLESGLWQTKVGIRSYARQAGDQGAQMHAYMYIYIYIPSSPFILSNFFSSINEQRVDRVPVVHPN